MTLKSVPLHLGSDLLPHAKAATGVIIDRNAFDGEIRAFAVGDSRYAPLVR